MNVCKTLEFDNKMNEYIQVLTQNSCKIIVDDIKH